MHNMFSDVLSIYIDQKLQIYMLRENTQVKHHMYKHIIFSVKLSYLQCISNFNGDVIGSAWPLLLTQWPLGDLTAVSN